MTDPISAAQAAQLTAQAQQDHVARNREAIQPALDYAYRTIRQEASRRIGMNAATLDFRRFNLLPEQRLAVNRTLVAQGYRVEQRPLSPHVFDVSWKPTATRGPGLPGQQHLTE